MGGRNSGKSRPGYMQYTNIGQRIATLGKQRELAKALGLSQQTVSKKLKGETAIFLTDIETLATKFKKTVLWFFQGYDGWPSAMPGQTPKK